MDTIDEVGRGGSSCRDEEPALTSLLIGGGEAADGRRERHARLVCVEGGPRRYGVNANLLFTWRRQETRCAASGGAEALKLLPVTVAEAGATAPVAAPRPGRR